jgi:xanthine/CO dehydrogenase XdhC/CoxF family maturation factor
MTVATDERVTADDIRSKLNEIDGSVQSTAKATAPIALAVGAAAVLAVVVLAYTLGKRRGRKRRTVVEIRRV